MIHDKSRPLEEIYVARRAVLFLTWLLADCTADGGLWSRTEANPFDCSLMACSQSLERVSWIPTRGRVASGESIAVKRAEVMRARGDVRTAR